LINLRNLCPKSCFVMTSAPFTTNLTRRAEGASRQ